MKRLMVPLSALLLAACLIAPGAAQAQGQGQGQGPERPRIALILKSTANEFFQAMIKTAVYYQSLNADKFDLITTGIPNETDIEQQIRLVDAAIAQKVDAIVLAPSDSRALATPVKRALDAGIKVINIDNRLDPATMKALGAQVIFVGPNNYAGAFKVGERMAKLLNKADKVALIAGLPQAFNNVQRVQGFSDALKAAGITPVAIKPGDWEREPARLATLELLREHPDLKAILCANDSMALGVIDALRELNRKNILVAGFDNILAIQPLLKSGEMTATAEQYGDQLAVSGIRRALSDLSGWEETPIDLITR